MKRVLCFVSACLLVLCLCSGAPAQVAYPPLLAAEAAPCPGCSMVMAAKDGNSIQAMLQSVEPADKLLDYYREALTAKGWDGALEMELAQAKAISFDRAEAPLALRTCPSEEWPIGSSSRLRAMRKVLETRSTSFMGKQMKVEARVPPMTMARPGKLMKTRTSSVDRKVA